MPFKKLAHQLGLGDIPSDVDVFEDSITSSNSLNVAKSSHLPLAEVETSQDISTTDVGVVAHQIGCSYVSKDLIRPLLGIASNVEPQKTISRFKLSYISGMWRTLCECITEFSVESSENLKELEAGVALILKVLREVNIVNLSPLEVLLEDSFKNHRDNPCCRAVHFSKDNKGFSSRLEELQKVLIRAEKELKVWTPKKKKTISLIEDHQKKLPENQETITNREDEIHAIEKIIPLSETEIELAKLKKDAETSRHQILSHKLFP
ncbi:hypothetical protein KY285_000775 [Solanum tuberosum]|nr:hypothetical protein KY285_000775 [Solanum tuberosum]